MLDELRTPPILEQPQGIQDAFRLSGEVYWARKALKRNGSYTRAVELQRQKAALASAVNDNRLCWKLYHDGQEVGRAVSYNAARG